MLLHSASLYLTIHALTRQRVGLDGQKRSESPVLPFRNDSDRSGLCSKLPDMRSLGDIALNPSLRKSKRYRMNSSCKSITLSLY